jgi:amino acid adenylation domain-containing protein
METVTEFLDQLASRGVKLSARPGELSCYARKGALTNDLKDGIIRFKPELIAFLGDVQTKQETQTDPSSARQATEFPLSAGQTGLYILQKLHPAMSAYNVPLCFRINADIDGRLLATAWDQVMEQFPILTARVIEQDGALYQRLDDSCRTTLQQRAVDFADDAQLLAFLQTQAKQPFDLNRGPLTRIQLFIRGRQKPILLLTVHHIVFDGASAVTVLTTLLDCYRRLSEGKTARLSQQVHGYHEFVAWEEAMLASAEGAAHARYWRRQLDGELPAFELVPGGSRLPSAGFEGQTLVDELPEDLGRLVHQLSKAQGLPPSVIFLALFQLLLHRYSDQDDIIVGMPVLGRAAQQFAAEVGYFINMVPLRAHCGTPIKLIDFLRKVQGTMMDALYHSSYPFPLMVEGVRSRRSEQSPIFRVSYAYQNFANAAEFVSLLQQQMFQLEFVTGVFQEGDFELGLEIYETPASSFVVHLKYDPELYPRDTISRFFEHYCALLSAVCADPGRYVHEYPILTEREKRKLLVDFNATGTESPQKCIHELFIEQVAHHPENTAVVCGDEQLTYRQLHQKSRDLALYLQSEGVEPDRLVGVRMERSLEMVVALLGVLQAGGAYIPLDPREPAERLARILHDSQAAVVMTEERLQQIGERVAVLKAGHVSLQRGVRPHDLAYVIYTSAATGQSRGVEVTHRSLVNLLSSMRQKPGITQDDTLLAVAGPSSDLAALELYLPLCSGARLVLASREASSDGARLLAELRSSGATMLQATPATWRLLLDAGWRGEPKLTALCAGEPLPRDLADALLETGCAVWNLWGSAETAICSGIARVEHGSSPVPLGSPIGNTQIYIVDRYKFPQPPGLPGELHVAGEGLARGYRHDPEATEQAFVGNPFTPGTRMHKTGDRARWRDDGSIELLDRNSRQAGEIESWLNQHPKIDNSAVFARGRDLVALYQAKDTHPDGLIRLPADELRGHMSRVLPASMVPATFISVPAIPLDRNGRIDRRVLPAILRKQQLAYWREQLAGVGEPVAPLPDYAPAGAQRFEAHRFTLDAQLTGQLKRLAERRGGTLFMSLLAAFQVLLHRHTGQNDVCAGTLGMSSNPLALRVHVEGEDTFSAFLSRVKATCQEAYENQDVPFDEVVEMPAGRIFRVMVILQPSPAPVSTCELTIAFTESQEGLTTSVEYDAAMYKRQTIERMAGHFTTLCRAITARPTARIRDLGYLDDAEKHRLLIDFNDTRAEYPGDQCTHQLFARQAGIHAGKTAVMFGEQTLTYQELDQKSRDLALYLQSEGVRPDSIVGLCAERSLDTVVGMVGILRAGGACLPMDPADPDDRLAYILQDSQAAIVLTQEKLKYRIGSFLARNAKSIVLGAHPGASGTDLRQDVRPHHLSCVVYPAAAGKPAGVLVEHKALVSRIAGLQRRDPLNANDAVLQSAAVPSLLEVFRPLLAGATLRIVAGGTDAVDRGLYGPAEAAGAVAIGAPIDNTQVYILDPHYRLQPIGVAGEVHVAGDGLARGYLNRSRLTLEKFVANPFTPGTRMFRSGDLARWLDDGSIQFLGRIVSSRSN